MTAFNVYQNFCSWIGQASVSAQITAKYHHYANSLTPFYSQVSIFSSQFQHYSPLPNTIYYGWSINIH